MGCVKSPLPIISKTMVIYILLSLILWFVVPLFLEGRIRLESDNKVLVMLCRFLAVVLIALSIFRDFL